MAQIGRFIDGPLYGSQDFADFFTNFLSTGFFTGLETEATDTMNVIVTPGSAFVEGYEYRNTNDLTLQMPTAEPSTDRIDRIVIRLDRTPDASEHVTAMVRRGTEEPPDLMRNESVYEISLAQITVEAGKSYIEQYQITDERGDREVCGRVSNPNRITDQIDAIDVKGPNVPLSNYAQGIEHFYVHGEAHQEILEEWLNSIGISPADYGRSVNHLRLYVQSVNRRNNTGFQRLILFDWDQTRNYRIYGIFTRTSNSVGGETWGSWVEEVFVVEKGENSRGNYTMYSDGTMECFCSEPNSPEVDVSTGNMYRTETFSVQYPVEFTEIFSGGRSLNCQGLSTWGDFTGAGGTTNSTVRLFSPVSQGINFTTNIWVKGRWR
jgi:hypothetical protein